MLGMKRLLGNITTPSIVRTHRCRLIMLTKRLHVSVRLGALRSQICGGETMLCCTIDNSTGQVQPCRKPAGTRVMPGMPGSNLGAAGTAGIHRRSVEGGDPADEEAPIPSSLTPEVAKEILKDSKRK